jgi:hypothetical protein
MAVGSVVLLGLLAMAPNWAIVDIPYPEAGGGMEAHSAPTPEARVIEALTVYARGKSFRLRKGDIADLKIEGPRATARLMFPNHPETLQLELVGHEWRIVKAE